VLISVYGSNVPLSNSIRVIFLHDPKNLFGSVVLPGLGVILIFRLSNDVIILHPFSSPFKCFSLKAGNSIIGKEDQIIEPSFLHVKENLEIAIRILSLVAIGNQILNGEDISYLFFAFLIFY